MLIEKGNKNARVKPVLKNLDFSRYDNDCQMKARLLRQYWHLQFWHSCWILIILLCSTLF